MAPPSKPERWCDPLVVRASDVVVGSLIQHPGHHGIWVQVTAVLFADPVDPQSSPWIAMAAGSVELPRLDAGAEIRVMLPV